MESGIFLLGLLLFCSEITWLHNDLRTSPYHLLSDSNLKNPLGEISSKENDVRVRTKESLLWNDAEAKQSVFGFESILTSEKSKAEVSLLGGAHIEVDENSLVVIEPPEQSGEGISLNLKRGTYHVTMQRPQKIVIDHTLFEAKNEEVKLNIEVKDEPKNSPVIISVTSGKVKATELKRTQARPVALTKGQVAQISKEKIEIITAPPKVSFLQKAIVVDQISKEPTGLKVAEGFKVKPLENLKPRSPASLEEIQPIAVYKVETPKDFEWAKKHFDLWLGAGLNYFSFSQTVPNLSNVNTQVVAGPSYSLIGDLALSKDFGAVVSYKNSPGALRSGGTINVNSTNYALQTFSAEGSMLLTDHFLENKKAETFLRVGLQQNYLPFLTLDSGSVFSIHTTQMTMALLGLYLNYYQTRRLRFELGAHYQYPFRASGSGSDNFSVSPQYAFDATAGLAFKITPSWLLGVYWSGQLNQYNYNFLNGSTTLTTSGSQTLFYSNGELRLGYDF